MVNQWLSVLSCGAHLTLAVLTVMRGARSALRLPFALLCVDFFAWNFASLAYDVSGRAGWFFLERTTSPFSAPLAFHLFAAFTGRLRRLRWMVVGTYACFAAISVPALLAFGVDWARSFATSEAWAGIHLLGVIGTMGYSARMLVLQLRWAVAPVERASTQLLLLALAVGSMLACTELVADLGIGIARLGHIGTLCGSTLVAVAIFRFRLFESDISWIAGLHAVAIGVVAILAYLAVFEFMADNAAMVVWGTTTVTLAVVLTTRASVASAAERRQRVERLATLGRFSAQMAHDLKNPLAALKGAVQFLLAERQTGRGVEQQDEFMQLLAEQIDRMERIVDQYQRLGRVEPILRKAQVNGVVRSVLALHAFSELERIDIRMNLCEGLPDCNLDEDLVAGALENLIRNALEAMPCGGKLAVETKPFGDDGRPIAVVVTVQDTGAGMDVRVKERAFDDFFTTKASGSGLGLAFVRRVAEAHGATVELVSALGRGTSVCLRFPIGWEPRADAG